jgi:hypothetical protein
VGDTVGYRIAVAGVSLALVAFAASAGVILANGHDPTQSFWTLASGLSGALIGILAPAPSGTPGSLIGTLAPTTTGSARRAATRDAIQAHTEMAETARQAAKEKLAEAGRAIAANDVASANTARELAEQAMQTADHHAKAAATLRTAPWSIAIPLLLLIAAACELVLFVRPSGLTPDLAKQLQAFAAAAAGAAIGLLAPSPASR